MWSGALIALVIIAPQNCEIINNDFTPEYKISSV